MSLYLYDTYDVFMEVTITLSLSATETSDLQTRESRTPRPTAARTGASRELLLAPRHESIVFTSPRPPRSPPRLPTHPPPQWRALDTAPPKRSSSNSVRCVLSVRGKWRGERADRGPDVRTAGTSSIVHETTHQPLLSTLSGVVETVVHLRAQGHKVVLVSSGAIGVGLKRMDVATRPKSLSKKQVRRCITILGRVKVLMRECGWVGIGGDWAGTAHRAVGQLVWTARAADCADSFDARGHLRRKS